MNRLTDEKSIQQWNANLYQSQHSFVWQMSRGMLDLLNPQPGERILDLGCGTGQLTQEIAERGAIAIGIDSSIAMIEQAQKIHPDPTFILANAQDFQFSEPFDAVFSNAVLHWIKNPQAVIQSIHQALKPDGRLVAEFGGKGNVQSIINAFRDAFSQMNLSAPEFPWYFPGISEYTGLLEQQGFEVVYAVLFDRPTPLESGAEGLANWLQVFGNSIVSGLPVDQQQEVINRVATILRPTHFDQGRWTLDYRRLRIVARK